MKVSATIQGRKDSLGRQRIYIRITDGQKRTLKATDMRVHKTDFAKGIVKASHPQHKQMNLKIREEILNVEKVGGFVDKDDSTDLFSVYALSLIDRWKQKRETTLRQYRSEVNKFKAFDTALGNISPDHLQKYRDHLYEIGNNENTQWKSFKFLKTVIHRAVKEGLIKNNPFDVFESPKYRNPQKKWLTDGEVKKLEKLRKERLPGEILFTLHWFLIGCYTALRFGDMVAFNKRQHIKGGRLILYTSKTGEIISIPLSDHLKGLFEAVGWKPLHYTNETYNKYLKQVGGLANIHVPLSAHLSRHTAAVRWANGGLSQEVVGKLMAHQSLATTSIYFKITSKRIDDELRKLL